MKKSTINCAWVTAALLLLAGCNTWNRELMTENERRLELVDRAKSLSDMGERVSLLVEALDFAYPVNIEGPNPPRLADREAIDELVSIGTPCLALIRPKLGRASRLQKENLALVMARLHVRQGIDLLLDNIENVIKGKPSRPLVFELSPEVSMLPLFFDVDEELIDAIHEGDLEALQAWRDSYLRYFRWNNEQGRFILDEEARAAGTPIEDE